MIRTPITADRPIDTPMHLLVTPTGGMSALGVGFSGRKVQVYRGWMS